MTKKQKKSLQQILIALALVILLKLLLGVLPALPTPVELLLYLIPYLVVGKDVLRKAIKGVKNRQPFDECFLMAVATVGAFALGDYVEGCAVILFYQIGELFQSVAVGKSRQSISSLMDIRPDYANVEDEDGKLEQVDPDDVEVGTVIVVQPGERVPIDGVIVEGTSALNTAALTGESLPRDVQTGDEVISGCVNMTGLLKVRTTKEFGESTVSKILDLVENSSMKKARAENFITRFARVYTPAVCYGALALAFLPPIVLLLMGQPARFGDWIYRALTFLVISCPCALVISIPLSFFGGIGGASACGILVKGSTYLEELARTGIVVFDKTGTITRGVVDAAADWDKPSYEQDTVKEGSREAIAALRARGIRTVMLSGDKAEVAGRIAREVGIDTVICEVKPDGKAYWIAKLQRERDEATAKSAYGTSRTAAQSRTLIAMVGDGINDAPALAQADLGIAIGTGTDVAMQSADVTLMSGDLRGVIKTINLSNATMRNIRENLGWAFGYNVIGIPVAAGVLYPFTGWLLSPMIAGLAMALSSVCLVLNANRLHGANINVGAADGPAGSGSSMADVESAGSAESANAANITGSATSNAPHEPTVIIDDRTTLNQTNHVSDQSNNPTNKENTMDTGMHMHHTAPADGETATDPVCGMTVAVNADAITREYEGKSYYFCGEHCATNFMKAPQVFLEQ